MPAATPRARIASRVDWSAGGLDRMVFRIALEPPRRCGSCVQVPGGGAWSNGFFEVARACGYGACRSGHRLDGFRRWCKTARRRSCGCLFCLFRKSFSGAWCSVCRNCQRGARAVCMVIPSFSCERLMDVSNVYGQALPLLSNRTKLPLFLTPGEKETIHWSVVRAGLQRILRRTLSCEYFLAESRSVSFCCGSPSARIYGGADERRIAKEDL